MITTWQGSSRPNLFHLFASKNDEMENILDKERSILFLKAPRSQFCNFPWSYGSNISSLKIRKSY